MTHGGPGLRWRVGALEGETQGLRKPNSTFCHFSPLTVTSPNTTLQAEQTKDVEKPFGGTASPF